MKDIIGVLEISVSVGLNWNATPITLTQMKRKLDELQKDVNSLLEADYKAALKWLKLNEYFGSEKMLRYILSRWL